MAIARTRRLDHWIQGKELAWVRGDLAALKMLATRQIRRQSLWICRQVNKPSILSRPAFDVSIAD